MQRALAAGFASLGSVVVFVACSGSSGSTFQPAPDQDSGIPDSGGFVTDDGGGDSGGEAGPAMCTPSMPASLGAAWSPPTAQPTACTATAIGAYYDACLSETAQRSACDAYVADAANATCVGCIEGKSGEGPIEWHDTGGVPHHDFIVNFPTCVALEENATSADGCGAAWHAQLECERVACDACFATSGSAIDIRDCACTAEGGSIDATSGSCRVPSSASAFCTSYLKTRVTKCAGALDAGSPATSCLPASGQARADYIKQLIKISCSM